MEPRTSQYVLSKLTSMVSSSGSEAALSRWPHTLYLNTVPVVADLIYITVTVTTYGSGTCVRV